MKKQLILTLTLFSMTGVFAAPKIELNKSVSFSAATEKEEPPVGGYENTFFINYDLEVKSDQTIKVSDLNSGFACSGGTQKGLFVTFMKGDEFVSTSDNVWLPSKAVSKADLVLKATPGTYSVIVTAYSTKPCFKIGGSLQLTEK